MVLQVQDRVLLKMNLGLRVITMPIYFMGKIDIIPTA